VRRRKRKEKPELLAIHGAVLGAPDPAALARRLAALTGLEPLRRTRDEVVLGGPELFVIVRKRARSSAGALEEIHVAVKEIGATRRKATPDPLGGDSWKRTAGDFVLVVRQFRRPPSRRWRRKRS
jgi:hypothetical protein